MMRTTPLIIGSAFLLLLYFGLQRVTRPALVATASQVIGIALTANHATLTRRHSNGTFDDLGRVEALDEYVELVRRFTSWGSEHPSPPYNTMEDAWNDWPRQMVRSARKAVSLPASTDVAIVAKLLTNVQELVEETDTSPISSLISFPGLRGLYQEDIIDAASYVGLRKMRDGYVNHPHELVAAFAANGLGLNTSNDGPKKFPVRPTLLVEYTEDALLLHHEWMDKAIEITSPHHQLQMSFDMGSDQNPSEQDILDFVLSFLYDEYVKRLPPPMPAKVTMLITGSAQSLADGKVDRATSLAVKALGAAIESFSENPEYMAARGAAELAWLATRPEGETEL